MLRNFFLNIIQSQALISLIITRIKNFKNSSKILSLESGNPILNDRFLLLLKGGVILQKYFTVPLLSFLSPLKNHSIVLKYKTNDDNCEKFEKLIFSNK